MRVLLLLLALALGATLPASAQAFTHGRDVPAGTATWMAHGICSGVLVAPTRVLTAAHCVGPVAGVVRLGKGPRPVETIPVIGVTVHPRYANWKDPKASQDAVAWAGRYDVAILTLARAARERPLPPARHSARPGTRGWGYGFQGSDVAHRARQDVLPDARCRAAFPHGAFDARATLCVGDPGPGSRSRVCGGDSGGPLVADGHLIGLVTYGAEILHADCGSGPALAGYADVGALSDFVLQPNPAFLPRFSAIARVVREGGTLRCVPPVFAPGADIRSIAISWQRRHLRAGRLAPTTLPGRHADTLPVLAAGEGSQVRCVERITTAGGPLEQEANWLRVG
ncbi:MAG TPA: trypsin-like serine protease [Solirubrobacteraceae bacterium]|jgi:hypothetical protein